jgi:simple sugar transport system permease protein
LNPSSLLFETLAFLAPLAPAAVGALATEYAGTLNIALEGLILAGAFTYAAIGSLLGPGYGPVAGYLAALAVPALIAWGSDLFSRRARADSFVVGLGVNMLVPAAASILSIAVFGTKGVAVVEGLQSGRIATAAAGIPLLGSLFGHRAVDYLAYAATGLLACVLALSPFGRRARAVGMNPDSLAMAGLDAGRVRGVSYLISGLACGAAGAALAASVGAWVPNMSAGRGWIALVAVYLGGKRLGGTIVSGAFFALLLSLATRAQSVLVVPAELLMAMPYFITAAVVVVGSARSRPA